MAMLYQRLGYTEMAGLYRYFQADETPEVQEARFAFEQALGHSPTLIFSTLNSQWPPAKLLPREVYQRINKRTEDERERLHQVYGLGTQKRSIRDDLGEGLACLGCGLPVFIFLGVVFLLGYFARLVTSGS